MDAELFVVTAGSCEVAVPSVVVVVVVSSVVFVELPLFSTMVTFEESVVVFVVVEFPSDVSLSDRLTLWRATDLASRADRASMDHFW